MELVLRQLSLAVPLAIALTLTSARACNIEITASIWENTPACQSPSDFLQRISDQSLQVAAQCVDLKQGQHVYIEFAPLGDFLCVRPIDKPFCYWAYTSTVVPDTTQIQ